MDVNFGVKVTVCYVHRMTGIGLKCDANHFQIILDLYFMQGSNEESLKNIMFQLMITQIVLLKRL